VYLNGQFCGQGTLSIPKKFCFQQLVSPPIQPTKNRQKKHDSGNKIFVPTDSNGLHPLLRRGALVRVVQLASRRRGWRKVKFLLRISHPCSFLWRKKMHLKVKI
jgi:hypothetical protein